MSVIGPNIHRQTLAKIDAHTALYALLGNPVTHSLSPVMHNAAFTQTGYNGVYVALTVTDSKAAIDGLRSMGIAGASVTIPFKTDVMDYLDQLDPVAAAMGAVNTIVNREGTLIGYNTDGSGAVRALTATLPVKNKRIAVIGAGGASRGISYVLAQKGVQLSIVNRGTARGESLAKKLQADFIPLKDFTGDSCDVLINTTPVGMFPDTDAMPVVKTALKPGMVVMDVVYNPLTTRLLQMARQSGCETVSGVDMFVYQGAAQFELWTRIPAPVERMRSVVTAVLKKREKDDD